MSPKKKKIENVSGGDQRRGIAMVRSPKNRGVGTWEPLLSMRGVSFEDLPTLVSMKRWY